MKALLWIGLGFLLACVQCGPSGLLGRRIEAMYDCDQVVQRCRSGDDERYHLFLRCEEWCTHPTSSRQLKQWFHINWSKLGEIGSIMDPL